MGDPTESQEDIRVIGHPGEDWGSGCSPCGYNKAFNFGICVGYNSLVGMNCSFGSDVNYFATYEATCLIYDAGLNIVGGPRLNCTLPSRPETHDTCEWLVRGFDIIGPHSRPQFETKTQAMLRYSRQQITNRAGAKPSGVASIVI